MKIKIEVDMTTEEFQEVFIPSDKQVEFMTMTYDAYVAALGKVLWKQIDPYNVMKQNIE